MATPTQLLQQRLKTPQDVAAWKRWVAGVSQPKGSGADLLRQRLKTPADRAAWQRWVGQMDARAGNLGPVGEAQFGTSMANTNQAYMQGLAQAEYGRAGTVADFGVKRDDLVRNFSQMRQKMPYGHNARGILGGGIWKQDLGTALLDQNRNLNVLTQQKGQALGQFDLQRQQLENTRTSTLANLRAQRMAALQQNAMNRGKVYQ